MAPAVRRRGVCAAAAVAFAGGEPDRTGPVAGGGQRGTRRDRAETRAVKVAERVELFRRLAELDPHPRTELEYASTFELLVAVVLSAQATDVGVNKATRKLFAVANTPQAILDLGEDGLKRYIATIGLYHAKAKNIIATCGILIEKHGGEVPDT